jgi:hypothetical protein
MSNFAHRRPSRLLRHIQAACHLIGEAATNRKSMPANADHEPLIHDMKYQLASGAKTPPASRMQDPGWQQEEALARTPSAVLVASVFVPHGKTRFSIAGCKWGGTCYFVMLRSATSGDLLRQIRPGDLNWRLVDMAVIESDQQRIALFLQLSCLVQEQSRTFWHRRCL